MTFKGRLTTFVRSFRFTAVREYLGADKIWNPKESKPFNGGLQINVYGSKKRYADLAKFFTEISSIETTDQSYHEHLEIVSDDGETRLHFIFRKSESGDYT